MSDAPRARPFPTGRVAVSPPYAGSRTSGGSPSVTDASALWASVARRHGRPEGDDIAQGDDRGRRSAPPQPPTSAYWSNEGGPHGTASRRQRGASAGTI